MIDSRVLDNFSLYWLTNSATSAARLYWENREQNLLSAASQKTDEIAIPVAIMVFPDELYRAPGDVGSARLPRPDLLPQGRSGRALCRVEQPEIFSNEMTAAFKSLH